VTLDNHVFSGHKTELTKTLVPMEMTPKDKNNEIGKHLCGLSVFWQMAEKYGSRQVEDTKKKIDGKKLFS
jgi:hypothetical protein